MCVAPGERNMYHVGIQTTRHNAYFIPFCLIQCLHFKAFFSLKFLMFVFCIWPSNFFHKYNSKATPPCHWLVIWFSYEAIFMENDHIDWYTRNSWTNQDPKFMNKSKWRQRSIYLIVPSSVFSETMHLNYKIDQNWKLKNRGRDAYELSNTDLLCHHHICCWLHPTPHITWKSSFFCMWIFEKYFKCTSAHGFEKNKRNNNTTIYNNNSIDLITLRDSQKST
jgi:hypothetical protein